MAEVRLNFTEYVEKTNTMSPNCSSLPDTFPVKVRDATDFLRYVEELCQVDRVLNLIDQNLCNSIPSVCHM